MIKDLAGGDDLRIPALGIWAKAKPCLLRIWPYLMIFAASFLPFMCYFVSDGVPNGHDVGWHLAYSGDLLHNFEEGYFDLRPSSLFFGSLSYSVFSLYAPLSEYLFALVAYLFKIELTTVIKAVSIFSVFLSGIFVYRLAIHVTKGSRLLSLAAGLAYIFFPYRLVCFLCRAAYPEAIALGMAPLLFLGLYRILHDERNRFSSWLIAAIGAALLLALHPFTALVVILSGVFYILFSFGGLKRIFTQWSTAIYLPLTVFLLLSYSAFYLLPLLSSSKDAYYVYYDPEMMGTSLSSVLASQNNQFFYSGLLNFEWLDSLNSSIWRDDDAVSWTIELCAFSFAVIVSPLLTHFSDKKKAPKALTFLIGALPIVMAFILSSREEAYLGCFLLLGCHILTFFLPEKALKDGLYTRDDGPDPVFDLLRPEQFALVAIIIISIFFLFSSGIWEFAPSIFRNCQFPFRFWGVLGVCAFILLIYLLSPLRDTGLFSKMALFASCLGLIVANPLADKRIYGQNGDNFPTAYTDEELTAFKNVGNQNEYLPRIFYDDQYASPYENSLYAYVKRLVRITKSYPTSESAYRVSFLTGEGTYEVNSLDTPSVSFDFVVKEDSLIQLAQLYYDGYRLTYTDMNGNENKLTPFYLEGLLAFELPAGEYAATLEFVGSDAYRMGEILLPIGIGISLGLFLYERYRDEERGRKASLSLLHSPKGIGK